VGRGGAGDGPIGFRVGMIEHAETTSETVTAQSSARRMEDSPVTIPMSPMVGATGGLPTGEDNVRVSS